MAIILVVLYHAHLGVPGGFVGVDVFFVISGFVITRLLVARGQDGSLRLGDFFVRRARRLLPALGLMIAVVMAASLVELSPFWSLPVTAHTGRWAAIGASNFAIMGAHVNYFSPVTQDPLLHTWSLGVEEQFYLGFGLLLALGAWLARRSGRSLRVVTGSICAAVIATSLTACLVASSRPLPDVGGDWGFYHPASRAWEFALGGLIACCVPRLRAHRWLAWAGLAAIAVAAVVIDADTRYPGWPTLLPTVGTAALILGAVEDPGAVGRGLQSRLAVWIGDRSYAWYLWHWPSIVLVGAAGGGRLAIALAAVASLGIAAVTFRFGENPIRQRRPPMRTALIVPAASVGLALLASFSAGPAIGRIDTGHLREFHRQIASYGFRADDCTLLQKVERRDLKRCTFDGDGSGRPIIVMGDSNAAQFNGPVVAAAHTLHRRVTLANSPSCGLIELQTDPDLDCLALAQSALRWLAQQPPSVVVTSDATFYVDDPDQSIVDPTTGRSTSATAAKARLWADALRHTYAQISAMGHTIVHVDTIPHFATSKTDEWEPAACVFLAVHRDPARCGRTATLASLRDHWAQGLAAEGRGSAHVRHLDLASVVCPRGRCRTNDGNFWIYRDGMHLSEGGSQRLEPRFVAMLRGLP
jgi:peptidoglycan/LPS O-acetylase OafA/YrhL